MKKEVLSYLDVVDVCLFDLDNTLVDIACYQTIRPTILAEFSEQQIQTYIQDTKSDIANIDTGTLCAYYNCMDRYYAILTAYLKEHNVVLPEVLETLRLVHHRKKRIGIVSHSFTKTIQVFIDVYSFPVDFTFSSQQAGCKKDTKHFWEQLILQHNLTVQKTLMVGDTYYYDIQIPQQLGFHTCFIGKSL